MLLLDRRGHSGACGEVEEDELANSGSLVRARDRRDGLQPSTDRTSVRLPRDRRDGLQPSTGRTSVRLPRLDAPPMNTSVGYSSMEGMHE